MLPKYALRLKEARTKKKLTQIDVMKFTGINNKTLSGYEHGVSEPDFDTLKSLSDLYGVSTDWLLGKTNNPDVNLTDGERALVQAVIDMDTDAFLEGAITYKGRELTKEEKQKLQDLARLFLNN